MAYFDQSSGTVPLIVLGPVTVSNNNAQVSQIIDTTDFGAITFYVIRGNLLDVGANFVVTFRESNDSGALFLANATAVPAENLIGNADFTSVDEDTTGQVGYVGKKRFVEITITPFNNGAGASFSVLLVKSQPVSAPSDPNVQ